MSSIRCPVAVVGEQPALRATLIDALIGRSARRQIRSQSLRSRLRSAPAAAPAAIDVARPSSPTSKTTALIQTSSSAVRNRVGIWVRKRPSASSTSTPRMLCPRAGHADVADEGGAAGQDPRVGGRDVGVGAEHGGHAAVEVPAHRDLLARHLGVEVDDHDLGAAPLELGELGVGGGERGASDGQLQLAAQVEDADLAPADLVDQRAAPGVALRVVGRPDDPLARGRGSRRRRAGGRRGCRS